MRAHQAVVTGTTASAGTVTGAALAGGDPAGRRHHGAFGDGTTRARQLVGAAFRAAA
jgi:hypothetical protein